MYLIVNATRNLIPGGAELKTANISSVDLLSQSTDTPILLGTLGGGKHWEIDFLVYIPEGTKITGTSATFSMHIVYTPSDETPP
ncbi:MAG: hypothetical protein QXT53_02585 [Ignisphaera sp.]